MTTGRNETEQERLDRKFDDMLQELRVIQTGVQLTAGFLLTLPFQALFWELDRFAKGLYLTLVLLAALTSALVMAPIAIHRRLSGQHVKGRLVAAAHHLVRLVLVGVALLVTGMVLLIFDVVTTRTWAGVAAGAIGVVLLALLAVLPGRMVDRAK